MDIDPMESATEASSEPASGDRTAHLGTRVAISVAILATFLGICKVKDDNIVQAMQAAQAKSVDSWNWFQAKKIRADVARSVQDQFEIMALSAAPKVRPEIEKKIE